MKTAIAVLIAIAAAQCARAAPDPAPSDAAFSCPPDIAKQLVGEWAENPPGSAILHRGGPRPEWGGARFRRQLWFGADGTGGWLQLAPDDAHYGVKARYTVDANCRISMQATQPPGSGAQGTYQTTIVAFDGNTLRIQGGYP